MIEEDRMALAQKIMDKWHRTMNEVAMKSLDPMYMKWLNVHHKMTRDMSDEVVNILEKEIEKILKDVKK
jgi:hypothetical protein